MTGQARILIVVSSMAIGGPQKSLIGLLERLDFDRLSVDLLVLAGERGSLSRWLPEQVRVLSTPQQIRAAMLPRSGMLKSVLILMRVVRPRRVPLLVWRLIQGLATRGGKQRMRQHVWCAVRDDLPRIPGKYDAALGILGLSTYAIVDLADARYKYHWIRSDTRVLKRDESVDGSYYRELAGAVAVSQMCADIFLDMYQWSQGRVFVYKNDIPRKRELSRVQFDPAAAESTLLTVSRLDQLKGVDLAVDACRELVNRGHSLQWVVVGEGPERASLEALVEMRGLAGVFHLVGSVLDTTEYLNAASIYVHPSRTEGRSNSVEEARAAGKPIVATAYETVKDQIDDGVTGLICSLSSSGIAAAVERLIFDPALANLIGMQARAEYEAEVGNPTRMLLCLADGQIGRLLEVDG